MHVDQNNPESQHEPSPIPAPLEVEGLADGASETGGTNWWFLIAILAVLVIYPTARWVMGRSSGSAAPNEAAAAQLKISATEYQAGRYDEAAKAAKAAVAADPNSADAYNNLAVSLMALKQTDAAIEAVTQALRIRPDYQLAKNNLAWFQGERAKGGGATPGVPEAQQAQSALLLNQSLDAAQARRFDACVDLARKASTVNPENARAFSNLGFCLGAQGKWDEGIAAAQEAIRLDPSLQLARNNLNWMQQEQGKAGKR